MTTPEPILETSLVAPRAPEAQAFDRRFTVGAVVAKTVSVWWKHVLAFTAMSIVVYTPLTGVFGLLLATVTTWNAAATAGSSPSPEGLPALGIAAAVVWLLTLVLAVIQAGAVTYGTFRHLSGERVELGEMIRVGFRRGLPIVAVGVLLWVGIMLGMVLLLVPGLMLLVASCVAIPAAVVERPGTFGAIRRSFALTRGYRWGLFAAGLAVLVIVWVLAAVVQVGATVVFTLLLPQQQAMVGMIVASQLGNVFFSALPLVGISVAYHELRVAKEGIDTAALAKVFE